MCVILHKLKEQKPFTLDEIKKAMETNPDGFSITTIANKGYNIYKELDKNKFYDAYKELYDNKALDDIEYVIHCRIMTNGKVCKDNCHPFENENFVLWHNGIVSEFSKDKTKVDSEQFLNKYFTDKKIKTETVLKRFATEPSSKFILLRKDTGEVIQSDNFKQHDGNYISNDYFLNTYTKYYNSYKGSYWDKYMDDYYYDNYDKWYEKDDKDDKDYKYLTSDTYYENIERKYDKMIDKIIDLQWYIDGNDTTKMTKEQLIEYVVSLEDEIYSLY